MPVLPTLPLPPDSLPELDCLRAENVVLRADLRHARELEATNFESQGRELATARTGRAEAERLGHIKDDFLANLSHEIRTPLNAILGWSQLLKPGESSDADMLEGLAVITRNARVQAQLIDDLLDMSRVVSGQMRLDVQRVDLPAVIDAALASMRPAADAKGLKLQKVVDPVAGPVTGDPARLQQVVWNLLSNAIKFTPTGGKVQVVVERASSHVELSVSDTGQGIAPQFLPHVFERFSQADVSTSRRPGGLGLGLAIVKSLVELHGGSVRAKSGGVNKGTTFIVSLPVSVVHTLDLTENRQHPSVERSGRSTRSPDLTGVTVMVVDDEPDACGLVRRIMEGAGAAVTTCGSGTECLASVGKLRPSVVIVDIGMSGMDGFTMMETLRTRGTDAGGFTPAVALTAFAGSEDRRQAMLAGFDIHVAKPVEPGELVAVVSRLSRRSA